MKKILFALACVMATAMTLTSCFPETGYSYSQSFSRVTTVDTTETTVKFIADYTGEEFKNISNLMSTDELAMFNLDGAKRAEILIRLDVDASYKSTLLMLDARKIDVRPITNKMSTEKQMPLLGLQYYPLGGTTLTPAVWVSNGYLNMLPQVPSNKSGTYRLTPQKAQNDSLFFKLTATYEEDSQKILTEDIHCYDLRTLRDTTEADAELRAKMREVLAAMEAHRKDSVSIFVTGEFIEYNYDYQGRDTIYTRYYETNPFKYDF